MNQCQNKLKDLHPKDIFLDEVVKGNINMIPFLHYMEECDLAYINMDRKNAFIYHQFLKLRLF